MAVVQRLIPGGVLVQYDTEEDKTRMIPGAQVLNIPAAAVLPSPNINQLMMMGYGT